MRDCGPGSTCRVPVGCGKPGCHPRPRHLPSAALTCGPGEVLGVLDPGGPRKCREVEEGKKKLVFVEKPRAPTLIQKHVSTLKKVTEKPCNYALSHQKRLRTSKSLA